jgi:hypothetical protein
LFKGLECKIFILEGDVNKLSKNWSVWSIA